MPQFRVQPRWLVHGALGILLSSSLSMFAGVKDEISKKFTVSTGDHLLVDADRGSIQVIAGESSEVSIRVNREVTRGSEKAGAEVLAKHSISFEQQGDLITVKATYPDRKFGWTGSGPQLQVRYAITVPKQYRLDLTTSGGEIVVGEMSGSLRARTSAGRISVGRFNGTVNLRSSGGGIELQSATNAVLDTSAGNIVVDSMGGPLQAKTSGGGIEVRSAQGDVSVRTSAGNIELGAMGAAVKAETSGGGIRLKSSAGKAYLKTSAGEINIGSASDKLTAITSGGGIEVREVKGDSDLKTSAGSIVVGKAEGSIRAYTSGGRIDVGLANASGADAELVSSAGGIVIALPEAAKYDIDAHAFAGEVSTDVPVTISGKVNRDGLTGQMNGGGHRLKAVASGGGVHFKRWVAAK